MKRSVSPETRKVKKPAVAADPLALLAWYDRNRRIMPWRALPGVKADPYRVWLSEIMLQQTTVAAVAPYFQKFIRRWPTIRHLAKTSLNDVMKMWAGLGYYRRARFLHACAKHVYAEYGSRFPETEAALLALPGFGAYTAAAVTAIAFDRSANVVDGNVERVMARLFAIRDPLPKAKAKLRAAAATLLPLSRHGDYAQALMDLGATICTPRNPKCDLCPWNENCRARERGIAATLPRRVAAKPKPVRHAIAFVLFNKKGEIFLRQRPEAGLLGGMTEIPSSDWLEGRTLPVLAAVVAQAPAKADWRLMPGTVTHVFSHFELQVVVAVAIATRAPGGRWAQPHRLKDEGLPSVMHKIARHALKAL